MQTPQSRFEDQQRAAALLGTLEPDAYFRAGLASDWLLLVLQGIERLRQYCLAVEVPFGYDDGR